MTDLQRAQLPGKREAGEAALALMDEHLAQREWFVGCAPSLADIALYAYTHVCEDGGYQLARYRHIGGWLARVARLPGYVAIAA